MQNFTDTFETRKRLFISAFSICMTVPLMEKRSSSFTNKSAPFERGLDFKV